jgi:hypothetical protein
MTSARRRLMAALVGATTAVVLAGCGLADTVVGLHSVPSESVGGAPINEDTAVAIATRVIAAASAARAETGDAGVKARAAVMTGSALAMADAAVASRTAVTGPDPLTTPTTPKVLAMVKGRSWPRTILATTLDPTTSTQYLHVLVSATPTSRFLLTASVPMLGGASVPSLGSVPEGVQLVTTGDGLVGAPAAILAEYAAALAFPKPAQTQHIDLSDALSTSLKANAVAQAAAFKKLASVTQAQKVVGTPTAFRLADGGALVFGQLARTDTITAAAGAKKVTLPAVVATLLKRTSITRSVTVTSLETVVFLVPTTGKATVIGADDQLGSAKGS